MTVVPPLLWLAACGADPSLLLSETAAPRSGVVFGQELLSKSSTIFAGGAQPVQGADVPIDSPRVVRSQSADWPTGEMIGQPPQPMGWSKGAVDEFIMEMNPLAPIALRTVEDYYDPYGWQASFGTNGHQPWRLGWVTYNDLTILPYAPVTSGPTGATGQMQFVEWNSNIRISELIAPGVLFNGTAYFNAEWWNGPNGIALPSQVDQISTDLELGFFNGGPWSGQIAFHPQIVDGYDSRLNRYAFNFDGRAIATYKASPSWSFVGGVAFWDRVSVLVVPHVGVIWAPNERWELRLLYPKSRISYYVGRWSMTDFWVYGAFEYTAEAWQANVGDPMQVADRIQLTDDRLSLGLRWDSGRYSLFVEAGYVFNRQAKFIGPTPDFNLGNIEMFRVGARY